MKAVLAIIATMLACSRALDCYNCQDRKGGDGSPDSGYEDLTCDPDPTPCNSWQDNCETVQMSYTLSVGGEDRDVNWVLRECRMTGNIRDMDVYCNIVEGMAGDVQGASMSGFSCSV